ncbi:MAG: LysR family transcriptional regulator [Myxococcota bacterium]
MELHQVRYALALAECSNFTRAAERCRVSQPALTAAIKKLEGEMGGPLFHRDRTGAHLTPLGQLILPKFRHMLTQLGSIEDVARNFRAAQQIPFRVGVLSTIGAARIGRALRRFSETAPGVELEVVHGTDASLRADLEDGGLEVAVTSSTEAPPPWAIARPLYQERYVVVLPPGHRLSAQEALVLSMLDGERYVDRLACERRGHFLEICSQAGVELVPTHRSENDPWVEALVQTGCGLAIMPEYSLVSPTSTVRPLVEPSLSRDVVVWRNADHARTPTGRLLWDAFLRQ